MGYKIARDDTVSHSSSLSLYAEELEQANDKQASR